MEISLNRLFHSVILLSSIKYSSAYCYGCYWYGSWYVWFSIVMVIAICCGAIGSYFRRRQIRRSLEARRNANSSTVVEVTTTTGFPPTSDRPYVNRGQGHQMPNYPNAPYPTNGAPYPPNGVHYPPNGAPYPANGAPYPPQGAYPQQPPAEAMCPPPYHSVPEKEKDIHTLPPSYQQAIGANTGYDNHGADTSRDVTGNEPHNPGH